MKGTSVSSKSASLQVRFFVFKGRLIGLVKVALTSQVLLGQNVGQGGSPDKMEGVCGSAVV